MFGRGSYFKIKKDGEPCDSPLRVVCLREDDGRGHALGRTGPRADDVGVA